MKFAIIASALLVALAGLSPFASAHRATAEHVFVPNNSHVTVIKVRSQKTPDVPDGNGPTDVSFTVAYKDSSGVSQKKTINVTLEKDKTPRQMAEKIKDAVVNEVGPHVTVKHVAGMVTIRGVDLPNSDGSADHPKKSPAPPPDPEGNDAPWIMSESYDQSDPPQSV